MLKRVTLTSTTFIVACAVEALSLSGATQEIDTNRVYASFDLSRPEGGPFPSDIFTVEDATQNTGHRVNYPLPDCAARPTDCDDLAMVNTLVAPAAGLLSWMAAERMVSGKPSMLGGASGAVAGLVAVTPAAGASGHGLPPS